MTKKKVEIIHANKKNNIKELIEEERQEVVIDNLVKDLKRRESSGSLGGEKKYGLVGRRRVDTVKRNRKAGGKSGRPKVKKKGVR